MLPISARFLYFETKLNVFLKDEQEGVPGLQELAEEEVDVVYGGPPCQGFSQIGPRLLSDPRNRLYKEFVRVVRLLKPRAFVMENVPNMVAMCNGHYKSRIMRAFRSAGYKRLAVLYTLASEFGVPQHRRRVFFVGLNDRLPFPDNFEKAAKELIELQKAPHTVTVREALSDLPAAVSKDDAPLPYPKKPGGRYSDYQKLMRLDWDSPTVGVGSQAWTNGV